MATEMINMRYDIKATRHEFQEGEKVWLRNPVQPKGLSLSCNPTGIALKRLNNAVVCTKISLSSKPKVVHYDRLAPYYGAN